MPPLRARVDPGAMAIKMYSAFPKAEASLSDCLVSYPGHLLRESWHKAIIIRYSIKISNLPVELRIQ